MSIQCVQQHSIVLQKSNENEHEGIFRKNKTFTPKRWGTYSIVYCNTFVHRTEENKKIRMSVIIPVYNDQLLPRVFILPHCNAVESNDPQVKSPF